LQQLLVAMRTSREFQMAADMKVESRIGEGTLLCRVALMICAAECLQKLMVKLWMLLLKTIECR